MSHLLNTNKKYIQDAIQEEFNNSHEKYGSLRITIKLKAKEIAISQTSVARNMKELNIKVRAKKKYVVTTYSDHSFDIPDNLLNRDFDVQQANKVWVSDITYIQVEDDFAYLTTVIDLSDRMVVGWHLSDNMTAEVTTIAAFNKAAINR